MASMRRAFAFFFGISALVSGCVIFPRIDIPSKPDYHGYFKILKREEDGSMYRFGSESSKERRPYVDHASADGKPLWRRSFGVLGNGGHGSFTAGAVLPDGGVLAIGAEKTQTTVAVVRLDSGGKVVWGREIDLPAQAGANADLELTEDGLVALVPLGGDKGANRLHLIRIAQDGSPRWATTVGLVGRAAKATWSKTSGLTFLGARFVGDAGLSYQERMRIEANLDIVTRVAPDGELAWMTEVRSPDGLWELPELASTPEGDVLVAVSKTCARCGTHDVEVARIAGDGSVRWGLDVHRPAPPETAAEREAHIAAHRDGYIPPLPYGFVTARDEAARDGSFELTVTFLSGSRANTALAVMRFGADGQLLTQHGLKNGAPAALTTTPARLDPVKLQPVTVRTSPTDHDLGPEIARTERTDL